MEITLSAVVALLVALSVASERLVEIIKGIVPWLNEEKKDRPEGRRKAALQALAVVAGIATAFLARPAIQGVVPEGWSTTTGILAIGLLASGGSGFWNSVLTYVQNVKDMKKELVKEQKAGKTIPKVKQ